MAWLSGYLSMALGGPGSHELGLVSWFAEMGGKDGVGETGSVGLWVLGDMAINKLVNAGTLTTVTRAPTLWMEGTVGQGWGLLTGEEPDAVRGSTS